MRAREAGFSLVEVMTAMFIAALAAAAVVWAIPAPAPDAQQAAQRLAASLTRAQRASVIESAPVGLTLDEAGYAFAVWRGGQWRALDRASGLGPGQWPAETVARIRSETSAAARPPAGFPAVIFDETGGATPFELELSDQQLRITVRGDASGRIDVEAPDA